MFRNQYDNDITTWSPQGRLHQVEYAMEAVKQGSCCVGVKSKSHAVLAGLMRSQSELAAHQTKIFRIDDHMGIGIAGLASDARSLCKFMQSRCMSNKYVYNTPLPVKRLVATIGDKLQVCTQRYGRRPYGVGLLVAGYDELGPHIFETCPSSNYHDCRAMAIGSRSQSAKTYLERHLDDFPESELDPLITHAVRALRESLPNNVELSVANCVVSVVGKGQAFKILKGDDVKKYIAALDSNAAAPAGDAMQTD